MIAYSKPRWNGYIPPPAGGRGPVWTVYIYIFNKHEKEIIVEPDGYGWKEYFSLMVVVELAHLNKCILRM
jgi:hypothetical protein